MINLDFYFNCFKQTSFSELLFNYFVSLSRDIENVKRVCRGILRRYKYVLFSFTNDITSFLFQLFSCFDLPMCIAANFVASVIAFSTNAASFFF